MNAALEKMRVEDDGLVCPEVRSWAETKYRLVSLYDELFAKGMKNKWSLRVPLYRTSLFPSGLGAVRQD